MPKRVIIFTVPGQPRAKQRPRLSQGGTYTPKATKDYEKQVKIAYLAAGNFMFEENIPLRVDVSAFFKAPKKLEKTAHFRNSITVYHKSRPDGDNILKIILDALNGVAYKDDGQVSVVKLRKLYGKPPRVEVTLQQIDEEKKNEENKDF